MADSFASELRRAAADLRGFSTQVRREIRPAVKRAAEPMVAAARANASWSTRIPGAIKISTLKRGVEIRVSRKRAPHARPYEGIAGGSTFRHPVYGNRDRWVTQQTRPFLEPAVRQHMPKVRAELIAMLDDAATRHGYR